MSSAGLTADGERFEFATTLTEQSVFTYRFATNASGAWVHTFESYGPVHQSDVDRFTTLLPAYMIALLVQIGLLFYLLLAFSWFSQRSRDRMEEVMKERQQMARGNDVGKQEESFVCSECGSDVPASAGRCPQCAGRASKKTRRALRRANTSVRNAARPWTKVLEAAGTAGRSSRSSTFQHPFLNHFKPLFIGVIGCPLLLQLKDWQKVRRRSRCPSSSRRTGRS